MPPMMWAVLFAKSMSPSALVPSSVTGRAVYTGVGDGTAEALADGDGLAVGEAVGADVGEALTSAEPLAADDAPTLDDAEGAGESVITGVSVAAAWTPTANWPPASRWKWMDCRFLRVACVFEMILWGSVRGADEQPARSATTARRPAAAIARDFRRDT
jgi:hypothetical protein